MQLKVRKFYTFTEDTLSEAGRPGNPILRKVAAVAIVENPYAGRYVEDLKPLIEASEGLGRELAKIALQAITPYRAQSYGKGGIVGLSGEQEHINALLTTTFANPLRDAAGGGKAWISSMTKRGGPGTSIDIPLASKDALYVRSHYDGMTITLYDAPLAEEIAVIICVANRGRLNARVGGLKFEDIKGEDRAGMKTAIVNLGAIINGDWRIPITKGDSILMADGKIAEVGTISSDAMKDCDVVIDAAGATAIPGLIDSQVHNTFGDYTPRQKTVGFLESYTHGGITSAITASEVHVPGRPTDPEGVKALAVAAFKCYQHYRPGGMRVYAGSMILEPGLTEEDFKEVAAKGVWLTKAGFGAVKTPFDYVPLIGWAKKHGMITTVHTGGSSIPGSAGIWAEHLIAMQPHVSFHVNGGPVAMPDEHYPRIINETQIALQVVTAGNLRTTLMIGDLVRKADQFGRFLIATDTPTGSGIMPLGMLYMITYLASLSDMPVEWAIAAATGNNASVYRLNSGFLKPGCDADVVVIDACLGGSTKNALDALRNGDIPAVAAVVTDGVPRFVGKSRNTPAPIKKVRVIENRILHDFSQIAH